MEPVESPVEFLMSENRAAPLFSAIALKIFILVRLARSCVSPVNIVGYAPKLFISFLDRYSYLNHLGGGDTLILRFNIYSRCWVGS
jgi:hypothetical protein